MPKTVTGMPVPVEGDFVRVICHLVYVTGDLVDNGGNSVCEACTSVREMGDSDSKGGASSLNPEDLTVYRRSKGTTGRITAGIEWRLFEISSFRGTKATKPPGSLPIPQYRALIIKKPLDQLDF